MAYPITDIRGIEADVAAILKKEGIRTTIGLLRAAKTPKQRLRMAEKIGTDCKAVLDWATAADRMRVKGVGFEYAELLRAAGVRTVSDLKNAQSGKSRQTDGRSEQRQACPLAAEGQDGRALDRKRQEAAADHSLLIG